ncbi:hypothetical protein PF005_g1071 [Phytophthora fragariae]|uniref:Uncharacterized protein n=1 Tax=Phytophthora fragariae TaxID=53985 RepID=A0A6A3MFR0_9STRA|nr:hypothetical protein PF009_g1086 [Phytophthora fragariae]KAE9030392.1 hypothetical protein PF011_g656 [Phytophthora fragariae]KAE9155141.1 hypothetical protein PF006_g872 [Phytophthora fragariae]KAE9236457.1 hypothetical protein PF005_g1071 [Phytophthora fragariae]KAE9254887.1 hypothetical protein PF004_g812 [Phytophthora fragariae]
MQDNSTRWCGTTSAVIGLQPSRRAKPSNKVAAGSDLRHEQHVTIKHFSIGTGLPRAWLVSGSSWCLLV